MLDRQTKKTVKCAHCGITCEEEKDRENHFCCKGCEQIYLLLNESDLTEYYQIEKYPGIAKSQISSDRYDFLEDDETAQRVISFTDSEITRVNFTLPAIHCSSCLWLLEHLHRLHSGIQNCRVNFLEKKVFITYDHQEISLKEVVVLLNRIGYEPEFNFALLSKPKEQLVDHSTLLKIGVAGFAFGNIMLLSFPEYLGFHEAFKNYYIGYINIVLAIPVLLYSGRDYLVDAYKDLKQFHLGIHVPLAIGMLTLFTRSVYEITASLGEGYLDSFTGFVLFLLVGKWFQGRTQKHIEFDRDYRSYFPISVDVLQQNKWSPRTIDKIKVGDTIRVKNSEIIPCDGYVRKGTAHIDYSFVTGESDLKTKGEGEQLYAGGKHSGSPIYLEVSKAVQQGYLTQLWNESTFNKDSRSRAEILLNKISRYFTLIILAIAILTFLFWLNQDPTKAYQAVTAVLIVACPCALALSVPFLLGSAMRILAKKKFYVRSIESIEKLADVDTIIFDKTGTITENHSMVAKYSGTPLSEHEQDMIYSVCSQSNHPLSGAIVRSLDGELYPISKFREVIGEGIEAICDHRKIRVGSDYFTFGSYSAETSRVFIDINGDVLGSFSFNKNLRSGIQQVLKDLASYNLELLSGDGNTDKERMEGIFPNGSHLYFNHSPKEKLEHVRKLQKQGRKVLMVGDGLNDAGALKQSDVGIVVVEENNTFTPACDVILNAKSLQFFSSLQSYFKNLKKALYGAFLIAFIYNVVGLTYAVSGNLSPLVAAILMPASSMTIIAYSFITSKILAIQIVKDRYD